MKCQCVEEEDCRPLFSPTFSWHMPSAEKCQQCLLKRQYNLFKHFGARKTKHWFSKGWSTEILIHFTNGNIPNKISMIMEKRRRRIPCFSQISISSCIPTPFVALRSCLENQGDLRCFKGSDPTPARVVPWFTCVFMTEAQTLPP